MDDQIAKARHHDALRCPGRLKPARCRVQGWRAYKCDTCMTYFRWHQRRWTPFLEPLTPTETEALIHAAKEKQ